MTKLVTKVEGGFVVDIGDNYPRFQRDNIPKPAKNNEDVILILCETVVKMNLLLTESLKIINQDGTWSEIIGYPEGLSAQIKQIIGE